MDSADETFSPYDTATTDSTFYYTCAQGQGINSASHIAHDNVDFRLRVYDMTAPSSRTPSRGSVSTYNPDNDYGQESKMKLRNSIQGHEGGWTITDSHLSPDNERRDLFFMIVFYSY